MEYRVEDAVYWLKKAEAARAFMRTLPPDGRRQNALELIDIFEDLIMTAPVGHLITGKESKKR